MAWVEVFAVFVVCHLVGDYLLQTDWQATNKRGGLGTDPEARRALAAHILTYTLAFIPAFIWLGGEIGAEVFADRAVIVVPHWIQDDGRLLTGLHREGQGPGGGAQSRGRHRRTRAFTCSRCSRSPYGRACSRANNRHK